LRPGQPLARSQFNKGCRCEGRCLSGRRRLSFQFVVVQSQGSRHRPHTVGEGQGSGGGPEGFGKPNGPSLGLAPTV
jgi:hypothetical protein